ncbi:MAG: hypothetical protein ABIC36_01025 [bacterium]
MRIISSLYNDKKMTNRTLEIYLFAIPAQTGAAGGANLGTQAITLECSGINQKTLPRILSVIFHETAHILETKHFACLLEEWVKNIDKKTEIKKTWVYQKIKDVMIILNEIITSSLLPEGYLSEIISKEKNVKKSIRNYFKDSFNSAVKPLPKKYRTLKNLRYYSAYHLYPFIKKYISQGRALDEAYIQKTYQLFREFEGL